MNGAKMLGNIFEFEKRHLLSDRLPPKKRHAVFVCATSNERSIELQRRSPVNLLHEMVSRPLDKIIFTTGAAHQMRC
jgi:hypothetical protein